MLCENIPERETMLRTYTELLQYPTFEDRFNYLKLSGQVGEETFGFDRWLNQRFYKSKEWQSIRDFVIIRDGGFDMAMDGYDIGGRIYVHHMNPIEQSDILHSSDILIDPEYLVCVSHNTHNAIHYGDASLLMTEPVERRPGDTCPWRM